MGYYTSYDLSIEPYDEGVHRLLLEEVNEGCDPFEGRCKWYDWEKDMRAFSAKHPDYVFHINGAGEDNEDLWAAAFKNGKAHIRQAEINIPPFDEDRLE